MKMHFCTVFSLSLLSVLSLFLSLCNAQTNTTFRVGVILDADSIIGRIGNTSLSLALSDFYSSHSNYSTRIVLHTSDSRGQVTDAADRAITLLRDVQVDAIIGPQTSTQANFVIGLGDAANVPVISFSATSPSFYPKDSYFLETAINDAAQVDAIAAIVKYFKWSQVVLVYEDSDFGNGITPYLSNAFQQVNARVSYRSIIPISATNGFILQELYKMKTMQTRVFVVHTTSSLASRIFLTAKEAEMTSEGYVWIVTTGILELFYSLDPKVVESMQGVLGVKPLVPRSSKLDSTTVRWKKKFADDNPGITPQEEMTIYGLWAYDTLWALAMAAEKVGFREEPTSLQNTSALNSTDMFITESSLTGPKLHSAMLETEFEGLSGKFRLIVGKLESSSFQILNINGDRLREVGKWTPLSQNSSRRNVILTGFSGEKLDNIIWPGESRNAPNGWEVPVSGKKLRVGVPAEGGFPEFVNAKRDPQTNNTKISGYYIDLFDSVMAALPYAVRYEYVPYQKSDGSNAGSYNELSYQVYTGVYDAVVGDITITATRSEYADFTLPIEESGVTVIQNVNYVKPKVNSFFLKPFTPQLWLTAITILILTGVALWILEHRFNAAFRGPPSQHVGLILYIPFMSLVFANRERIVSNLARIVIVIWIFVVLILSSTYTASLSARFTTEKLEKQGTDISTLKRNGDYVGCREGSFIFEFLIGLGFNRSNIKTHKRPKDFDDALSNGSIKAMFSRTPYTNLFLSKYCNKYMKIGHPNITDGVGFVFPKGSPLVADVSRAIIKLIDNQKFLEIRDRWIRQSPCNDDDLTKRSLVKMKLESFKILFGITGGITGTCLLVFLVSYLYENRDFIRRIFSNSSATIWSKLRAMFMHFDQRDPKSFRFKEDSGNASPDVNMYQRHYSTVDTLPSDQETASENGSISPNPDHTTAAAAHQLSSNSPP